MGGVADRKPHPNLSAAKWPFRYRFAGLGHFYNFWVPGFVNQAQTLPARSFRTDNVAGIEPKNRQDCCSTAAGRRSVP